MRLIALDAKTVSQITGTSSVAAGRQSDTFATRSNATPVTMPMNSGIRGRRPRAAAYPSDTRKLDDAEADEQVRQGGRQRVRSVLAQDQGVGADLAEPACRLEQGEQRRDAADHPPLAGPDREDAQDAGSRVHLDRYPTGARGRRTRPPATRPASRRMGDTRPVARRRSPRRSSERGEGDDAPARRERRRGDDRQVAQAARRPCRQVRAAARGHHRQGQRRGPVAVRGRPQGDPGRGRRHGPEQRRDRGHRDGRRGRIDRRRTACRGQGRTGHRRRMLRRTVRSPPTTTAARSRRRGQPARTNPRTARPPAPLPHGDRRHGADCIRARGRRPAAPPPRPPHPRRRAIPMRG